MKKLSEMLTGLRDGTIENESELFDLISEYAGHEYGPDSVPNLLLGFKDEKDACEHISQWVAMIGKQQFKFFEEDSNVDVDNGGKLFFFSILVNNFQ